MKEQKREIERKFLLPGSFDVSILRTAGLIPGVSEIEQGYIIVDGQMEVRIRRKDELCFLTVKGDGLMVRTEWEEEIPLWVFLALKNKVIGTIIKKNRFSLPYDKYVLEIDFFRDRLEGLVIMECEFTDEISARAFVLPEWAKDAVDVTSDKRYKNKNLAITATTIVLEH